MPAQYAQQDLRNATVSGRLSVKRRSISDKVRSPATVPYILQHGAQRLSSKCGQCHVNIRETRLNTDLLVFWLRLSNDYASE